MKRIAKLTILYHLLSDWKLAPWVQKLIGCNKEAYAHEVSVVDPKERLMTMKVRSLVSRIFLKLLHTYIRKLGSHNWIT